MAIPSSPPPDFLEPPSSPPLPPVLQVPYSRKRHLSDYESLSSDPIFSEDASESDEHTGLKRKRHYRGPWWAHGGPAARLRRMERDGRNADSGVWMGSDATEESVEESRRIMNAQQTLQSDEEMEDSPELPDSHAGNARDLEFRDRDFDAEVEMHSDDMDDEDTLQEIYYTPKRDSSRLRAESAAREARNMPTAEQLANRIIFDCLENNNETIDLSDMSLSDLPNSVLRPLHQLIRSPSSSHPAALHENYAPLTPNIFLSLATNSLTSLPPELWNLRNIRVLSLRNNLLTELSPAIGKLTRLQELNIAGNQLQCLPWELLNTIATRNIRITIHPNPLLEPVPGLRLAPLASTAGPSTSHYPSDILLQLRSLATDTTSASRTLYAMVARLLDTYAHLLTLPTPPPLHTPLYIASSTPTYYDITGLPIRNPTSFSTSFSTRTGHPPTATLTPTPPPTTTPLSPAPSLFELALRSCHASPYLNQLHPLLPPDAPPTVTSPLESLVRAKDAGEDLNTCTVCARPCAVVRASWVEWWHLPGSQHGDGSGVSGFRRAYERQVEQRMAAVAKTIVAGEVGEWFVPFQRRACGWACVARALRGNERGRLGYGEEGKGYGDLVMG